MSTLSPRVRTLEIVPNVYQLSIRAGNIILIVEEELTLIDAGLRGSSGKIIDFIHQLGRSAEEIGLIIFTHNHIDHIGGLAELRKLTEARVAIHKAGIIGPDGAAPYPGGIGRLLRIPFLSSLRGRFMLSPDDVDIQLEGGEVLEPLDGLQVVHTPGHTPGSISLYSAKHKFLIVGDALVKSRNAPHLPHKMVSTDSAEAVDSARKMSLLDFGILCFGHGRPLVEDAHAKLVELVERTKG